MRKGVSTCSPNARNWNRSLTKTFRHTVYRTPSFLRSLAWRTWSISWMRTIERPTLSKLDHCCGVRTSQLRMNLNHPVIPRKVKLKIDCPKNYWEIVMNWKLSFVCIFPLSLEYLIWVLAVLWNNPISRWQLSGPIYIFINLSNPIFICSICWSLALVLTCYPTGSEPISVVPPLTACNHIIVINIERIV